MWFGQLGISSALWTEQIARNWLTYQLTGSALQLGLVNLMRALPVMALGLWGGVLTDRLDRRMLFLIIQGWSFLVYVLMGWVVLSGSLALWHLYASSFALSLGMAMDGPLRTSTIPSTVPPERLINALYKAQLSADKMAKGDFSLDDGTWPPAWKGGVGLT